MSLVLCLLSLGVGSEPQGMGPGAFASSSEAVTIRYGTKSIVDIDRKTSTVAERSRGGEGEVDQWGAGSFR